MSYRYRPRAARDRPFSPGDRATAHLLDPRPPRRPSQRDLVVASLLLCPGAGTHPRDARRDGAS